MAGEKKTKPGVWIILGLLCFSLIGFGTTSLTSGADTVARVGDKEITITQYASEVRNQIRALSRQLGFEVTFEQANSAGVPQQVLSDLVARKTLENEAAQLGVSIGDQYVAEQVTGDNNFMGFDGNFDREIYRESLNRVGLNEAAYEQSIRDELAASTLQIGLLAGVRAPDGYTDLILGYEAQRRDITWAFIDPETQEIDLAEPTAEELTAFYEANAASYMTPETKAIRVASLTPADLIDSIELDEESLRALYAEREALYSVPERRLVERLGFSSDEAATAAIAAIEAGETTFDALVEDRGLTLDDVDLGDVAVDDLDGAGEAVFAANALDVVGPLPSLIGPALFRVNAVLAAENTSFEEARDELRGELGSDRARRIISDTSERLADLIAGGAGVEDLAENSELTLSTIDFNAASIDGMAAYPEFRAAATAAEIGDYPELVELSDGGVFALEVTEVRAPALIPQEEIADDLLAAWTAQQTQAAIIDVAQSAAEGISGGADFAEFGLVGTIELDVLRRTFIDRTPQGFIDTVFDLEIGSAVAMPYEGGAVVVRLDAINAPDTEDSDIQTLRENIDAQIANGVSQDLFTATMTDLQSNTEIDVDPAAVNLVTSGL